LDAQGYGLWAGASIHEIAQVVAAAFQHGHAAGDVATVAKLSRVMLLAPVVLAFGALARRGAGGAAPMPWFVLGFIAVIGVNSFGMIGVAVKSVAIPATTFLLTLALA
ncbi:putative sulfate exporter family transporter, partial [Staphylococcus aureus]